MRLSWTAATRGLALMLTGGSVIHAQATDTAPPAPASTPSPPAAGPAAGPDDAVPFSVGERLEYDVKFGIIHVGSGSMEVAGVEPMRGHDVWHTVFRIKGGTLFYHVNDVLESWFDQKTLSSLRFDQHLDEGGKVRDRSYVMYPDRSVFVLNQKPEQPSVPDPLDDGSFLYFVRTLPLNVGDTYTFNRYFNPKSNPVVIRVLRRERIEVPAGKFNAIVVQPIIKTSGIFSDKGEAHIWITDDSAHMVLQMKSKLSFGHIDLYLKSYQPGRGATANVPTAAPTPAAGTDSAAGGGAATKPATSPPGAAPSGSAPPPPPSSRR
jgi:uncharacterized protein DUF3108